MLFLKPNRRQFPLVYTLTDNKMMPYNVQNSAVEPRAAVLAHALV